MAKGAAKRIIADNKKALEFTWKGSLLASLFHLTVQLGFPGKRQMFLHDGLRHWIPYGVSCLLCFLCYRYLEQEARVVYNRNTQELVNEGAAITHSGLYEYVFDVIYLTWLLQVVSVFSFYFWLAYLLIPAYAIYKLWNKLIAPWIFGSNRTPELSQEDALKMKKKMEKKERHLQRTKYI
jgi:hypothetical protein